MDLKQTLNELRQQGLEQIQAAANLEELNQIRIKYLGKKGPINQALRQMKTVSAEQRPKIGALANTVRDDLQTAITQTKDQLNQKKLAVQ